MFPVARARKLATGVVRRAASIASRRCAAPAVAAVAVRPCLRATVRSIHRRAMHSTAAPRCARPQAPRAGGAAKPRAAKTARGKGKKSQKLYMALGGVSGVLGFWGYHLFDTKQTPAEWLKATYDEAWMLFEDAADPSEVFIRNSVQPMHLFKQQNFVGTVIVDLEDTILCRKWDRKYGYRFSKRPFTDMFLTQLSQAGFEIIFYSDNPSQLGMETLNKLIADYPPGTVTCSGLLGRDHMFFRDGHFVKRLQYLPRDMNRVVLVDADVETYKWNPRNTLLVKPYKDYDPKDTALKSATKMILAMRDSGRPYQQFMADFAQPSTDADGNLVPSEDALEKFAAEERKQLIAVAQKKREGLSGFLHKLKGTSSNLRRSKVISAHAMPVDEIMSARRTDTSAAMADAMGNGLTPEPAKQPTSLFERKMAKMHKRQREWEEKMKLMQAAGPPGQDGGAQAQ